MPRFYSDHCAGLDVLLDEQGRDYADLESARQAAVRDLRAIVAGDAQEGYLVEDQEIALRDETGVIVARVHFSDAVRRLLAGSIGAPEGVAAPLP